MKKFLSISTAALFMLLLLIGIGLAEFEETPLPEILSRTPPLPEPSEAVPISAPIMYDLLEISQCNLFDPRRGKAKQTDNAADNQQNHPPEFILAGICMMDAAAGAIIEKKRQAQSGATDKKRYFKIGDEVADGFVLARVNERGVTLQREHESLDLTVGRNRFGEQAKKFQISIEQQIQADKQTETTVVPQTGDADASSAVPAKPEPLPPPGQKFTK